MSTSKKIGTEIILNPIEMGVAKFIAKHRDEMNRKNGLKSANISVQSDLEIHINGCGAEFAFCKLFNTYPDFDVYSRKTEDDQGDAILFGKKVDVKTTKLENGNLIAPQWKNNSKEIELYALMIGELPIYIFKGFMTKKEFIKEGRIRPLRNDEPTYFAGVNELVEFETLQF